MRLAFLLLTYRFPTQIERLATTLARLFPEAPILINHDAAQGSLLTPAGEPAIAVPPQVEIVEVPGPRGWGRFPLVDGALDGFARLLAHPAAPDIIIQLSGQCYPIKPAPCFLDFFAEHPADAWCDARRVSPDPASPDYDAESVRRYFPLPPSAPSAPPSLLTRLFSRMPPAQPGPVAPFNADFHCYKGASWIALNRRAAGRLLEFHAAHPALEQYFRHCPIPDEAYPQTILCNDPELAICPWPLHHIRWPANSPNPALLTLADWPALQASPYLFARKFDPTTPTLLTRIDHDLLR
jgi:hypothetical protein